MGGNIIYKLVYTVDGFVSVSRNKDPKILRQIILCLDKGTKWELFNDGGIKLDSSEETPTKVTIKKFDEIQTLMGVKRR